jgi:hypothetical protein
MFNRTGDDLGSQTFYTLYIFILVIYTARLIEFFTLIRKHIYPQV